MMCQFFRCFYNNGQYLTMGGVVVVVACLIVILCALDCGDDDVAWTWFKRGLGGGVSALIWPIYMAFLAAE